MPGKELTLIHSVVTLVKETHFHMTLFIKVFYNSNQSCNFFGGRAVGRGAISFLFLRKQILKHSIVWTIFLALS